MKGSRVIPNPFAKGSSFRQALRLRRGEIEIRAGRDAGEVMVRLRVDANEPVIIIEAHGKSAFGLEVMFETWREKDRKLAPDELSHSDPLRRGSDRSGNALETIQYADTIVRDAKDRIIWFHHNRRSAWPATLKLQGLESLIEGSVDPLLDCIFGGAIDGDGLVSAGPTVLRSGRPRTDHIVRIHVLLRHPATPESWRRELDAGPFHPAYSLAARIRTRDLDEAREAHRAWWRAFWDRSWIRVPGIDTMTRGYILQRYLAACGGRGKGWIKFNGSIFTLPYERDPDFRRWAGAQWFQNARLVYWPLIASGDGDVVAPFFRTYLDALPLARARTRIYYGHDGAFFPETLYSWGTYANGDYGWQRDGHPVGFATNPYIRYYWSGGLELSTMMLEHFAVTQDRTFLAEVLLPLATAIIEFYDLHWKREASGKIRFEPAQSLETWQKVVNPLPDIAGVRYVCEKLLSLPADATSEAERARWTRLIGELPPLPTALAGGTTLLAPAQVIIEGARNAENPELYSIFPYRIHGVGKPDLQLARDTFARRGNRHNVCWWQDDIHTAYLGLTEQARDNVAGRLSSWNSRFRFPAMWGPHNDEIPDMDHGGVGQMALQVMLLQSEGKKLLLFPAWPKEWDVEFKLHAPYRTIVEGVYRGGKLERLAVTPPEREEDLVNLFPGCGSAPRAAGATFHVDPRGADPNDGTVDRPFATLERAREAVRSAKAEAKGPIRVLLRGGTHYLAKTFVLGAEDGGTADSPIEYAAYPGEKPVLSGGVRLDLRWEPHRDGIFRAEVPAVRDGKLSFDQLFLDGRRQHMARYPNYDPARLPYGGTAADSTSPERAKRWANPAGGFVHGLHAAAWGGFHYAIAGKDEKGELALDGGFQNNRRMGLHRDHRFVENIFEELDAAGEWFLDRTKGILYVFPPAGVDLAKARVEVAGLDHLIEIRGTRAEPVRFVSFRGIEFTHTGRTFMKTDEPLLRSDWCIYRGGAVLVEGAEDIAIGSCSFDAVGGNAIFVSCYNRRVEITGCRIVGAGASGICFVGDPGAVRSPALEYGQAVPLEKMDRTPGPRSEDYPAKCRVYDTLIRGFGVFEKQVAGVQIAMAEEITVSHATIHDCPRAGINIGDGCWGGHIIEGCDIFDTVKETGDHGSFNSWGRERYWLPDIRAVDRRVAEIPDMPLWDARKTTIIRRNRWRCDHGWDIDLDDGSTNYHIYENLCLNGGIKLREGYGRVVENNIMVGNSFHPHVWYARSGDVFRRNIVATEYRPIGMPSVWGKEIDDNLFRTGADLERSRGLGTDEHGAAGDPMFVDPAAGDYRVKDGSPALGLGFRNFPMDEFGVVTPELRAQAGRPVLPVAPAGE